MVSATLTDLNLYATFRWALDYPDEQRWAFLREVSGDAPDTVEELQTLYVRLFEAALPQPRCPLLESHYHTNRPAGEVVLGNKLFYKHFGLHVSNQAAPDHLLTQLEFLSWLEHAIAAGNPDAGSLERARHDFLEQHVGHWLGRAATLARQAGGRCYADLLESLSEEIIRR